jgi:hypothetical protein
MFSRVYAVLLVALTVLASRNQGSPRHRLSVWLAVVMLGSLQSPFAATFVAVTMIMLLLAMTTEVRGRRDVVAFVATLAVFSLPVPGLGAKAAIAVSLARMVPLYAFLAWVALRREKASEALSP